MVLLTRSSFVGGVLAAGTLGALPGRVRAAGPPTVRIGYLDSFSGPFAVGGIPQRNGAQLALADANRRGNVRWEFVYGDDQTKPAVGLTEARRLVEVEKVDVLVGGASSAVGNAVSAYAQEAGVLYVAVGTHDTAMTGNKANRVCFRQTCSLAMLTTALGAELVRRARRWYFLVADYAFGTDARDRLRTILLAHGGTIAGMDLHPIGTSDFSSYMVKARASDADAFLLLNGGTDTQNAATAFVQFGLQKRMLAAGVTGENELAAGFPAEELAGSLWGYVWGRDAGGDAEALWRRFVAAASGFPPNWRQYLGYMAVRNVVDRMHACGTTDTAALVKAFEGYRYDAAKAQPGIFRACDHQAAQETYCAEMLPRAKRRAPDEYFRLSRRSAGSSRRARATMPTVGVPPRSSRASKWSRAKATRPCVSHPRDPHLSIATTRFVLTHRQQFVRSLSQTSNRSRLLGANAGDFVFIESTKGGSVLTRASAVRGCAVAAATAIVLSTAPIPLQAASDTVKVGVLQSLTGTMAISEVTVKNAELLAIDQINAAGGVLGKKIVPVVEDGASDPAMFAQKAQKLIQQDGVVTVFGGWTSASRKAMLPVFERFHSLLWYPVQFEGNECSPNIMYSGAQPNQQILPALQWAEEKGYKSIFLLGSDYVFPRTANLILSKHIVHDGGTVAGEEYVPLGGTDFSAVISKIKLAKPQIIFNTLNGDSNVSFFKQMAAAGLPSSKLPVMSFSIAEQEAKAIGPSLLAGSYAAWNYFQSLPDPANKKFVAAYQAKYPGQPVDDPMAHGYLDVYAWAAAVKKAGTFDPAKVAKAASTLTLADVGLGNTKFVNNLSLSQTAYVGELEPDGQFKILWSSKKPVEPIPYDALSFPGKTCVH